MRLTWHGHCMAAVLAAHPAVASHLSAAWLRGLIRRSPARIEVTVPSSRRNGREFRIHFARLEPADSSEVDGIPSTSWARTLLDLTPISSDRQVERMLERSEELDSFDLRRLEDVLARTARHPGAARLGRAAEIYRPEPAFTRSRLERRFRSLVIRAGLPAAATNVVVEGFELDAYWPPERFAVELDVYETHGSRAAFERDREREDELLLVGIEMIRVTGMRLKREPRATVDRVAAHLERRRREQRLN
jgi:very-short-patch-repair endonuclease